VNSSGDGDQLGALTLNDREPFFELAEIAMSAAVITDAPARPHVESARSHFSQSQSYPDGEVIGVGGVVTAHSVMSRDVFSDVGSTSGLGMWPLKGMERAMGAAIAAVRRDLSAAAVELGCDRGLGVTVKIDAPLVRRESLARALGAELPTQKAVGSSPIIRLRKLRNGAAFLKAVRLVTSVPGVGTA
jgi:uncharacterized protein YbjQ (UPF0145 family)